MLPIHFIFFALLITIAICGYFTLKVLEEKTLDPNENHPKLNQVKLAVKWFLGTLFSIFGFVFVFLTTFNLVLLFIFAFLAVITGAQAIQRERQASLL